MPLADDISYPNENTTARASASSPLGHRVMFLCLAVIAFVIFAPTVLFPILREHGKLVAEEAKLQQHVARLEKEVRRRAELRVSFEEDVVVNERLAILDLRYTRPDEVVLPVLPSGDSPATLSLSSEPSSRSKLLLPDDWPSWATKAETWANRHGLISPFLDRTLRSVMLLMSGGLLVSAFILFAPRVRRPRLAESTPPTSAPMT